MSGDSKASQLALQQVASDSGAPPELCERVLEMVRQDTDKAVAWLKEHATSYLAQFVDDETAEAEAKAAKAVQVVEADVDDEAILEGLVGTKDEKETLCAESCAVDNNAASASEGDDVVDLASQVSEE